ncbi:DUF2514 family protein [Pseudomonas shirazensis]
MDVSCKITVSRALARAIAQVGQLAQAYDRAKTAGLTCEASYNALIRSGV